MRARHAPAYLATRLAPETAFQPPKYKDFRAMTHDDKIALCGAIDTAKDGALALNTRLLEIRGGELVGSKEHVLTGEAFRAFAVAASAGARLMQHLYALEPNNS